MSGEVAAGPVASVTGPALVAADGRKVCVLADWDERIGDGVPDVEVAWESDTALAVQLRERPHAYPSRRWIALYLLGRRTICGYLANPLAGRQLRDALTGHKIPYFDGSDLAHVRVLPDGFELNSDHLLHGRYRGANLESIPWSRLYIADSGTTWQYIAVTQVLGPHPEGFLHGEFWPIVGDDHIGTSPAHHHAEMSPSSTVVGRAISWTSSKYSSYCVEGAARARPSRNMRPEDTLSAAFGGDTPSFAQLRRVANGIHEHAE